MAVTNLFEGINITWMYATKNFGGGVGEQYYPGS
jgi:hypothetical protein